MRIETGFAARRTPGWPLAATLVVHLLLLWGWRVATAPAPTAIDPIEHVLMLVPLPKPSSEPEVLAPSRSRLRPARGGAAALPVPAAPPVPDVAPEAAPITETYADPFALPDEKSQAPDGVLERARRAAGATDHTMRKGKLAKLEPADTPLTRLRTALDAAHKDSSRGLTSETYTTPDGVTIYRFRLGGRVYCRTGGHVRPRIGGAEGGGETLFDSHGGGGAAGLVACPANAEFKRD
jgi:hypothetical protein